MLLGSSVPGVQYAGTFLGAMGIYPAIANTISWASNNTEGLNSYLSHAIMRLDLYAYKNKELSTDR